VGRIAAFAFEVIRPEQRNYVRVEARWLALKRHLGLKHGLLKFGGDLNGRWISLAEAAARYMACFGAFPGWYDTHARL
jgi:hypothetical protein